jgi:6-phosphofructokinase
MKKKNVFYAQSGGVTAVINASACGVIETARKHKSKLGRVYAGVNGILGALTEDMIDTTAESAKTIAALRHTPGGAFGSARYKLKGLEQNRAEYERLIEVFKAHDIGYFFYNGGGDSMDTAYKVSQLGASLGHPVVCIGVPKTVDNDLPITDTCPGFGSVAKYVAVSTREAALDVASMARTSTRVFILEVMGRHAGWIAAAGGLAGETEAQAPHIILFPEIPFDEAAFLARVKKSVEKYEYCVVVVSEGARYADGRFLAEAGGKDAFGHAQLGGVAASIAQLVRGKLGYKYHYAIAVMPTIVRKSSKPYRWTVGKAPLAKVANQEKMMPRNFISKDGFAITAACRTYLAPLIQGEDYPPYKNGLPSYVSLRNQRVTKRLSTEFVLK